MANTGRMSPLKRTIGLLAAAITAQAQGLSQTYCSNQNTGADYQGVNDIYNSNGACKTQCQGRYAFAIVQWQNCWCSNYIPADQGDTGDCNQSCPGYPQENCGNEDMGMYGYIQLSNAPSGTLGGSSSSPPQTSQAASSPSEESSSPPPPPSSTPSSDPSTETSYVSQTVIQTVTEEQTQRPDTDTVVSTVTPTPPPPPSSTTPESTSTPEPTTESTPEPTTETTPESTSSERSPTTRSPSGSPSPVVSTRVVTVSGQQVTQTVTSTPYVNPGSDEQEQEMSRTGLSGGAIAGIVIGTLIGLAAVLLAAFLVWRRKKQQDAENPSASGNNGKPPKRTTSVLSKTGLLSRGGGGARPTSMAEHNYDEGYASVRHSMLFGGAGASVEPSSPLGGSQDNASSTRRHSKPLVYDQRLNPSALFANQEANGSRVSMQDTQDYSRPLGVTNPDVRASFDSRVSER